ncbi:MAG: ATP synthase F1 subunit epsilon [Planctomycetes bacterium]|nr:ATP synthase F1 subunit epsilon [Planctomycetota bacterium]MCP4771625.1 ATP synthase F1 subunit epsilon [Planctomycetota bacterium]MCP4860075.1 ATP synthase F1 subunit epsilon [Planctomycetota bacterium]
MNTTTSTLTLRIVSPEATVLDAEVRSVQIPGEDGLFGVLPRHATMVATTDSGLLRATTANGEEIEYVIHGGFCEVRDNVVTILSRSAEKAEDIDLERAQKAAKRARDIMRSDDAEMDLTRALAALRRAMIRERLARKQ